jgi:hypothetical protein
MLQIAEISSQYYLSDDTVSSAYELLKDNFDCEKENVKNKLNSNSYKVFLVINNQNQEVCAIISYNIINHLSSTKYLEIYNFLIKNSEDSQSFTELAISKLESIAKKNNCQIISAKLATKNNILQKIFALHKFNLNQFSFEKSL